MGQYAASSAQLSTDARTESCPSSPAKESNVCGPSDFGGGVPRAATDQHAREEKSAINPRETHGEARSPLSRDHKAARDFFFLVYSALACAGQRAREDRRHNSHTRRAKWVEVKGNPSTREVGLKGHTPRDAGERDSGPPPTRIITSRAPAVLGPRGAGVLEEKQGKTERKRRPGASPLPPVKGGELKHKAGGEREQMKGNKTRVEGSGWDPLEGGRLHTKKRKKGTLRGAGNDARGEAGSRRAFGGTAQGVSARPHRWLRERAHQASAAFVPTRGTHGGAGGEEQRNLAR